MQTATSVGAVMIATTVLLATSAEAGRVRVSQEMETETGAKVFVVKGFVETFDKSGMSADEDGMSPDDVYLYNKNCEDSYGGNTFSAEPNATVMAVVDTVDGRTLFTVHGYPCGESKLGQASMSLTLKYDDDGMECLVRDDPEGVDNDTCGEAVDGIADIATTNEWRANRTDGFVLGWLDGWWQLDAFYKRKENIENVIVRSSDDGPDITGLDVDETIRLDWVLEVEVDVQPGAELGCLNSDGRGVIPVAIMGARGFDVSEVDPDTLRLDGLQVRVRSNEKPQCSTDYINDDDYLDLICQFYDNPEAWMPGTGRATVSGELGDSDSSPFHGGDGICVVPPS
jgi:hypothetical protein